MIKILCDLTVTNIHLACYVAAGTGEAIHINRPSHGVALALDGEMIYTFNDGRSLKACRNDLIFLPKGSSYNVTPIECGSVYAINFDILETDNIGPFTLNMKNHVGIIENFKRSEKAFRAKNTGYESEIRSELYRIIFCIIQESTREYTPSKKSERIRPAVEYIHFHYSTEQLEIKMLAEMCNMSEVYFRRIFRLTFGTSPLKYINDLKIERSKVLLSSGLYSVKKAMEEAGYADECSFSRAFKKHVGISPSDYKKNSDPI